MNIFATVYDAVIVWEFLTWLQYLKKNIYLRSWVPRAYYIFSDVSQGKEEKKKGWVDTVSLMISNS